MLRRLLRRLSRWTRQPRRPLAAGRNNEELTGLMDGNSVRIRENSTPRTVGALN